MVKQSCVSTSDRSASLRSAASSAPPQARAQPSKRVMSRLAMGIRSFTCAVARKRTRRRAASATSAEAITSAAAPSETSEQSVRLSGRATKGFFSLSARQKA